MSSAVIPVVVARDHVSPEYIVPAFLAPAVSAGVAAGTVDCRHSSAGKKLPRVLERSFLVVEGRLRLIHGHRM